MKQIGIAERRGDVLSFCRRLRADPADAEDLAQETMLIGLRHLREGRRPADWTAWLCGVARTLAKRRPDSPDPLDGLDFEPMADDDPLSALLARERGALLDAALSRLDGPARELLALRYLDETPVSELATRLGIGENAASQRLIRARESLAGILRAHTPEAAAAHGLLSNSEAEGWASTEIYCPRCGTTKLHGRMGVGFTLICPNCDASRRREGLIGLSTAAHPLHAPTVLAGAAGFRVGLKRVNAWWDDYLRRGLTVGQVRCRGCGRVVAVQPRGPRSGATGFYTDCPCGAEFFVHPAGLLLHDPDGQAFWRAQGKVRFVPERRVRIGGRDAVVVAFESVSSRTRLEAAYSTDDLTRLKIV